ncbi:MAG: hypothetical protein IJ698_06920 [Prevotella sp.]|nr:hypothetical protein [Prevotella sp.]
MRTNYLKMVFFALLLTVAFSCEKAIIDEEIDDTELPGTGEDNGGSGGGNGSGNGGGNTGSNHGRVEDDPLTVAEFIAGDYEGGAYVKGYIIGACSTNIKNADFEAPFEWSSAILLADKVDERDTDKMISIELKSGSKIRAQFNLKDHPENHGKQAQFFGYPETYLKIIGIKSPTSPKLFD